MGLCLPEDTSIMTHPFLSVQDACRANCGLGRLEIGDRPPTSLKWLLALKLSFGAAAREGGGFASALVGHSVPRSERARGSFGIAQAAVFEEVLPNYPPAWWEWQPTVLAPAVRLPISRHPLQAEPGGGMQASLAAPSPSFGALRVAAALTGKAEVLAFQ